jgi:hypothetical protein
MTQDGGKGTGHTRSRSTSLNSTSDSQYLSRTSSTDSQRSRSLRLQSITRTRSESRPRRANIDRVYSGRHLDDQSVYHSDDDAPKAHAVDSPAEDGDEKQGTPVLEVRGGILNERDTDLEASARDQSALEKSGTAKSDRSQRDPKLVSPSRHLEGYSVRGH